MSSDGAGPATDSRAILWVAIAAILFPSVYFVSDVMEVAQGGFSTPRLVLTYIGEAGTPLFVLALGWLGYRQQAAFQGAGMLGAALYAYSYVFFTSTVVYALVGHAANWNAVVDRFGWWLTLHGAVMVVGGLMFGAAIARSRAYPRWTAVALMGGVVLVAAAADRSNLERTIAATVTDAAFVGMGLDLLRRAPRNRTARDLVAATPGGSRE